MINLIMNKKDSLMNQNDVHLVEANVEISAVVVVVDLVANGYNIQ
jgi:hypothetical protein